MRNENSPEWRHESGAKTSFSLGGYYGVTGALRDYGNGNWRHVSGIHKARARRFVLLRGTCKAPRLRVSATIRLARAISGLVVPSWPTTDGGARNTDLDAAERSEEGRSGGSRSGLSGGI